MNKLNLAQKQFELRFKFKAKDNSERCIFQMTHSMERMKEDPSRNFVSSDFIDDKTKKAVNVIVTTHKDKPNIDPEISYFVIVTTLYKYQGKGYYVGFPLHWQIPGIGDKFVHQYTDLNYGKLTTFIVRGDKEIVPYARDIVIRVSSEIEKTVSKANYLALANFILPEIFRSMPFKVHSSIYHNAHIEVHYSLKENDFMMDYIDSNLIFVN